MPRSNPYFRCQSARRLAKRDKSTLPPLITMPTRLPFQGLAARDGGCQRERARGLHHDFHALCIKAHGLDQLPVAYLGQHLVHKPAG